MICSVPLKFGNHLKIHSSRCSCLTLCSCLACMRDLPKPAVFALSGSALDADLNLSSSSTNRGLFTYDDETVAMSPAFPSVSTILMHHALSMSHQQHNASSKAHSVGVVLDLGCGLGLALLQLMAIFPGSKIKGHRRGQFSVVG